MFSEVRRTDVRRRVLGRDDGSLFHSPWLGDGSSLPGLFRRRGSTYHPDLHHATVRDRDELLRQTEEQEFRVCEFRVGPIP